MNNNNINFSALYKKMRSLNIILLTAFIVILLNEHATAEKGKMFMSTPRSIESYDGKVLGLIYTEAFKRLGLKYVYTYYPAKRASMMAATGRIDGELAMVYNYNTKLPDLIRVEESVFTIKISAFTTNPKIQLNGWDSFLGTDYKVEYMRGVKRCAMKLS